MPNKTIGHETKNLGKCTKGIKLKGFWVWGGPTTPQPLVTYMNGILKVEIRFKKSVQNIWEIWIKFL